MSCYLTKQFADAAIDGVLVAQLLFLASADQMDAFQAFIQVIATVLTISFSSCFFFSPFFLRR